MKWIGQHIYDLVSRFRDDVYLEDISTGTIASGGNLGLDSNNKIVKAAEVTGDITSVVAGTNITGGGTSGDVTLNVPTASDSTKGAVELATTAETTTGTATGLAVTPDGLKDGYQGSANVVTVGTIGTGTWQGTAITSAYLNAAQTNITSLGTLSSLAVTSASDLGSAAMILTNADVDQKALYLNADNTTASILDIKALSLTSGNAIFIDSANARNEIFIDRDCTETGNQSHEGMIALSGTKASITGAGDTHAMIGIKSTITDTATNVGTSNLINLDLSSNMTNAGGTTKLHGISNTVTGASDDTVGYYSSVVNGSPDIKLVSSADATDYFTIATGAVGATTLTTVDTTVGATAHLDLAVDGQFSVASTGIDISGAGVVSNATWQGTAIATNYLKHKTCFELTGYSVADGSNYFYSNIMSGNKAPFLHDVNIGSDGLTADNPAAFLRANGTVMPYAGTLKIWKGWGASNGTPTVDVGIFKYTPTADDATNDSLVLVKNTQFTGAGNDNLKTFSETSFSVAVAAGDILITAIKGSTNAKTAYFVSTVEIEWS
jgi:hypothetical protein